jgi:hypothetical protein
VRAAWFGSTDLATRLGISTLNVCDSPVFSCNYPIRMLLEPDVAITDFGLAIETGIFVALVFHARQPWRRALVLFFLSVCAASLIGGVIHGFIADESTLQFRILWSATLICIGLTAFAAWQMGCLLCFDRKHAEWISRIALWEFFLYVLFVLAVSHDYFTAIINYLPSALFLSLCFTVAFLRYHEKWTLFGILGMLLTLIAAAQQHFHYSPSAALSHNAFYHVLQAIALFLIFWSTSHLAPFERPPETRHANPA